MRAVPISAASAAGRHRDENFPVASWLCPPPLRAPILAIYRFARYADDLADEGDASVAERQQALAALRAQLDRLGSGQPPEPRYAELLNPLGRALRVHSLPLPLLHKLLDAFVQDTQVQSHPNRAALLTYCERSANPVGRLLLHLVGVQSAPALSASDAICTALQLINFWQDVGVDRAKARVYLPQDALQRHGLAAQTVLDGQDSPALRACIAEELNWATALMTQGRTLPRHMPGRLSWELRLVIEGGLRVAEKIRAMDHATLLHRPRLRAWDAPLMLWRAVRRWISE
jgi:squalene synthase HpnC